MNFFCIFLLENLHMCWIFRTFAPYLGIMRTFYSLEWEVRFLYSLGAVCMSAFYFVVFCKAGEAYAATAER